MSIRRSTRVPKERVRSSSETPEYEVGANDLKKSASQKRKTTKDSTSEKPHKRSRNVGKLAGFVQELPIEVVFSILELLDPATLINISRTNRQFRNTLLGTDYIWKAARRTVGLPDLCATDITERQYVLLMFDKNCHDCSKPNVQEIDLLSCARLCTACRRAIQLTFSQYRDLRSALHPRAIECAKRHPEKHAFDIPRGVVKISVRLHTMIPSEVKKFVKERSRLQEQIAMDAIKIDVWLRTQAVEKSQRYSALRKSREASIEERLLALGWTDSTLGERSLWTSHKAVNQPRPLTDRIWNSIKDRLTTDLSIALVERRNLLRRGAVDLRYRYFQLREHSPNPAQFPSYDTFLSFPCVEPFWQESTDPPPHNVHLRDLPLWDEEKWVAALPAIRAAVREYQEEMQLVESAAAWLMADCVYHPHPSYPLGDPRSLLC